MSKLVLFLVPFTVFGTIHPRQSIYNTANPSIPQAFGGGGTQPCPISVTITSATHVISGNTLIVAFSATAPVGGSFITTFSISDTLGNSWSPIQTIQGSMFSPALVMYYAPNVIGGTTDTITVNATCQNGAVFNAENFPEGIIAEEYEGVATTISIQASNYIQQNTSTNAMSIALNNSAGTSITTSFTTTNQAGCIVVDLNSGGQDWFLAVSGGNITNQIPSVNPITYMTYIEVDGIAGSPLNLYLFTRAAYPLGETQIGGFIVGP